MTKRDSQWGIGAAKHHQQWVNMSEIHTFKKTSN